MKLKNELEGNCTENQKKKVRKKKKEGKSFTLMRHDIRQCKEENSTSTSNVQQVTANHRHECTRARLVKNILLIYEVGSWVNNLNRGSQISQSIKYTHAI